ncbi:MAG: protein kinase [Acidobacteriota bacterium]
MKECPKCQSCYDDFLIECPVDKATLAKGVPGPTVLAGKFRIEARLGKGGMATVYRAMHLGLKRYVALKTLHLNDQSEPEFPERFRREAEASGRIKHPHVVDVMDFGFTEVGGQSVGYLAMEFLTGQTLRDFLKRNGSLTLTQTVEIIEQICKAVDAAHKLGIIHRDLKPDNIWLEDRPDGHFHIKVLDFGIAKLATPELLAAASSSGQFKVDEQARTAAHYTPVGSGQPALPASSVPQPVIINDANNDVGEILKPARVEQKGAEIKPIIRDADSFINEKSIHKRDVVSEFAIIGTQKEQHTSQVTIDLNAGRTEEIGSRTENLDDGTEDPVVGGTDLFHESIEKLTETGMMIGTVPYMSPEQCSGKLCTTASDIYSLGVITYELLTGQRPFIGKSFEVVRQHQEEIPQPPSALVPELPPCIDTAVLSALAKIPNKRPSTAGAFARALDAPLSEARRRQANLRKIVRLSAAVAAVLIATAIISNWLTIEQYWYSLKVSLGIVARQQVFETFSALKLIRPASSQEILLSATTSTIFTATEPPADTKPLGEFKAKFSDDNRWFAFTRLQDYPPRIEIWNSVESKKIFDIQLSELKTEIRDLYFSSDGKRLIIACLNQVCVLDTATGQQQRIITLERNDRVRIGMSKTAVLLSASIYRPTAEARLGSVSYPLHETNSRVSLWQLDNGEKLLDLTHKYGEIESVRVSGSWALLQWHVDEQEPTRRVELWDLLTGTLKREWSLTGTGGIAIDATGRHLAIRIEPTRVIEFELESQQIIKEYVLPLQLAEQAIRLYYANNHLLIAGNIDIQDLSEGKRTYLSNDTAIILDLAEDGNLLLLEQRVTQARH